MPKRVLIAQNGKLAALPEEKGCPHADRHAIAPEGYIAWHSWAARMAKTHTQKRCPGCGLWKIWIPRGRGVKQLRDKS